MSEDFDAPAGRPLPHSIEAEENLLSSVMLDGAAVVPRAITAGLNPESFYSAAHGTIFRVALDLHTRGEPCEIAVIAEELRKRDQLKAVGDYAFLTQISGRIPTTAQAEYFIATVREYAARRALIRAAIDTIEHAHVGDAPANEIAASLRANATALEVVPLSSVIANLANRRAGFGRVVTHQEPTFSLAGTAITTRGNISMITAQKKEGKSAAVGAMLGAVIGGANCSGDALGFTADNSIGHAVIHIDSEQAPEDHERLFNTALKRAGDMPAPAWLYSYGAKGMSIAELRSTLARLLAEAKKLHGGILAVILDGVADFVADPNDPKDCNPFVTQLEAVATDYNCSVIGVLHLNPPGANGTSTKSRGHLGSQLERKCETDLRLTKDADGITTMFTACARRAPILEKDAPRFSWDTVAGMHTSLSQTKGAVRESAEVEALQDLATDAFGAQSAMRYSDLLSAIESTRKCSERTAERKFNAMKDHKVITRFPPNLWAKAV